MGAETQNTGYEGKLGHEKKFHKTHFPGHERTWKSEDDCVWVQVRPGRWKLLPQKRYERAGGRR